MIEIYLKKVGKSKEHVSFSYNVSEINVDDNRKIKSFFTASSFQKIDVLFG